MCIFGAFQAVFKLVGVCFLAPFLCNSSVRGVVFGYPVWRCECVCLCVCLFLFSHVFLTFPLFWGFGMVSASLVVCLLAYLFAYLL